MAGNLGGRPERDEFLWKGDPKATAGSAARAMLFGLKPVDPSRLALAAGGLTIIAVAASAIPATRAVGVDPIEILREE